jgi:Family of unknown function (DUF6241)
VGGDVVSWVKEHKLIVTAMIIVALCLGILGMILGDMIDKKAVPSSETVSKEENTAAAPSQQDTIKTVDNVTENPFGGSKLDLSEKEILNYMHGMSHQKVVAEEKWIHYEMTNERIQFLISIVENGNYKNGELFMDILQRWAEGDFQRADKDHNKIWSLQGGNVGEATGVMTSEEEQQYLEDNKGSIQ